MTSVLVQNSSICNGEGFLPSLMLRKARCGTRPQYILYSSLVVLRKRITFYSICLYCIWKVQTVKNVGETQHGYVCESMNLQTPRGHCFASFKGQIPSPLRRFCPCDWGRMALLGSGIIKLARNTDRIVVLRCCNIFHLFRQWLLWSRILDQLIFRMPETQGRRTKKWSLLGLTGLGPRLVPTRNHAHHLSGPRNTANKQIKCLVISCVMFVRHCSLPLVTYLS